MYFLVLVVLVLAIGAIISGIIISYENFDRLKHQFSTHPLFRRRAFRPIITSYGDVIETPEQLDDMLRDLAEQLQQQARNLPKVKRRKCGVPREVKLPNVANFDIKEINKRRKNAQRSPDTSLDQICQIHEDLKRESLMNQICLLVKDEMETKGISFTEYENRTIKLPTNKEHLISHNEALKAQFSAKQSLEIKTKFANLKLSSTSINSIDTMTNMEIITKFESFETGSKARAQDTRLPKDERNENVFNHLLDKNVTLKSQRIGIKPNIEFPDPNANKEATQGPSSLDTEIGVIPEGNPNYEDVLPFCSFISQLVPNVILSKIPVWRRKINESVNLTDPDPPQRVLIGSTIPIRRSNLSSLSLCTAFSQLVEPNRRSTRPISGLA